jgi:hypothetical protein
VRRRVGDGSDCFLGAVCVGLGGKKHEGFWEDMAFLVHWKLRNDNFEHALVGHSPLILPCRTDSGKVS